MIKAEKIYSKKKLDILQIHNANIQILKNKKIKEFFINLKKKQIIRKIGVTVYTEKEALFAIKSNWIDSIQVPYNLINQKMDQKVFILAKKNKIDVFTRSTFLKES